MSISDDIEGRKGNKNSSDSSDSCSQKRSLKNKGKKTHSSLTNVEPCHDSATLKPVSCCARCSKVSLIPNLNKKFLIFINKIREICGDNHVVKHVFAGV